VRRGLAPHFDRSISLEHGVVLKQAVQQTWRGAGGTRAEPQTSERYGAHDQQPKHSLRMID